MSDQTPEDDPFTMTDQSPSEQQKQINLADMEHHRWVQALTSALNNLAKAIQERDEARAALQDVWKERSHGAMANSEYIDRRIAEGLGRA